MSADVAKLIGVVAIVGTVVGLGLAALSARKPAPVRLRLDIARLGVQVGAIVAVAVVTGVSTPLWAVAIAVLGGGLLGVLQGRQLRVRAIDGRLLAQRTWIGVAVWGAGLIVTQVVSFGTRAGVLKVGQALAYFGAATGLGLVLGRTQPLATARRTAATAALSMIAAAMFVALAFAVSAGAQARLSDTQLCALLPPGSATTLETLEGVRFCSTAVTRSGVVPARFLVGQASSVSSADAVWEAEQSRLELPVPEARTAISSIGDEVFASTDVDDVIEVFARRGPFLFGVVNPPNSNITISELATLLRAIDQRILAALGGGSPAPATTAPRATTAPTSAPRPTTTSPRATVAPTLAPTVVPTFAPEDDVALPPPAFVSDEPDVAPEEAAAAAVIGLVGAGVVGLVGIGELLGSGGRFPRSPGDLRELLRTEPGEAHPEHWDAPLAPGEPHPEQWDAPLAPGEAHPEHWDAPLPAGVPHPERLDAPVTGSPDWLCDLPAAPAPIDVPVSAPVTPPDPVPAWAAGVAARPPLPVLDERGVPLVHNDGSWPDVPVGHVWWHDGLDGGWVPPDDATRLVAETRAAELANAAERAAAVRRHAAQADADWDRFRADARARVEAEHAARAREAAERTARREAADLLSDALDDAAMGPRADELEQLQNMVDFLDGNPTPTAEELIRLDRLLGNQLADRAALDPLRNTGLVAAAAGDTRIPGSDVGIADYVATWNATKEESVVGGAARWADQHVGWPAGMLVRSSDTLIVRGTIAVATGGWSETLVGAPGDALVAMNTAQTQAIEKTGTGLSVPSLLGEGAWDLAVGEAQGKIVGELAPYAKQAWRTTFDGVDTSLRNTAQAATNRLAAGLAESAPTPPLPKIAASSVPDLAPGPRPTPPRVDTDPPWVPARVPDVGPTGIDPGGIDVAELPPGARPGWGPDNPPVEVGPKPVPRRIDPDPPSAPTRVPDEAAAGLDTAGIDVAETRPGARPGWAPPPVTEPGLAGLAAPPRPPASPTETLPAVGGRASGPVTPEASSRWQALGADGRGRVYDRQGNHVLTLDPEGVPRTPDGRVVQPVVESADGVLEGYVDASGREVGFGPGGVPRSSADVPPARSTARAELNAGVRTRWSAAGAGPNGELYGPGGEVIGRIDIEGRAWTNDGREITGHGPVIDGRHTRITTADGMVHGDPGSVPSATAPSGDPELAALARGEVPRAAPLPEPPPTGTHPDRVPEPVAGDAEPPPTGVHPRRVPVPEPGAGGVAPPPTGAPPREPDAFVGAEPEPEVAAPRAPGTPDAEGRIDLEAAPKSSRFGGDRMSPQRDVVYVPQIGEMKCVAASISCATGRPMDVIEDQLVGLLRGPTGRATLEGVPPNELRGVLDSMGLAPRPATDLRNTIGTQPLLAVSRGPDPHAVVIDRYFPERGTVRLIDPASTGGVFEVPLDELGPQIDWRRSFFIGGTP